MAKWLFLRGAVPNDRDPEEIRHDSLENDTDMWIHLFYNLLSPEDEGQVVYYNAPEIKTRGYKSNFTIWELTSLDSIGGNFDYVFARGGFREYNQVLDKCPNAKTIYYGAGKRFKPDREYGLVLVDTLEQKFEVGENAVSFFKPASPIFKPMGIEKEYDICFIANGQQAKIKNIRWFYDNVPKDLSVLHLGFPSDLVPPENVTCKRVQHRDMPYMINKCRVGVVPYTNYDSGPRALSEMFFCGLSVVVSDAVNCNIGGKLGTLAVPLSYLFEATRQYISVPEEKWIRDSADGYLGGVAKIIRRKLA